MLDFSVLENMDITVRSLNVYANSFPILPPDSCRCTRGMRPFSRFFYVTGGEIVFFKGTDNEISAKKGDIVYLPHDTEYLSEWSMGAPGSFLTVNFIINDSSVVFSDGIGILAKDTDGSYFAIFKALHDAWTKGSFHSRLTALSIFMSLLSKAASDSNRSSIEHSFSDIHKGIVYIENHFWEDFTVATLCEMCCVSPATFRRKFKLYSQYSPITYRNYLRVLRAKKLLESGEYTVTEASLSVGFSDLCYFNRAFRKFFGINPSEVIL